MTLPLDSDDRLTTRSARQRAVGFTDRPAIAGGTFGPWRAILLVALLVVAVSLSGCQSFPQAEASLRTGISVNVGHVNDDSLPPEARTVAEKNGDLLWKVLFSIGGCEEKDIPADVRARQKAREEARAGGGS